MTELDNKAPSNLAPRGLVDIGAQSAGTTTLLQHCLAALTVGELLRADPVVQSLLHGRSGARS